MSKPIKQTKSTTKAKKLGGTAQKASLKNRKTLVDATPIEEDIDEGPIPLSAQAMRDLFPNAVYIPEEPFVALEFIDYEDTETSDTDAKPTNPKKKNQPKKPKAAKAKIIKLKREELEDGSPSPMPTRRMKDLLGSTD